MGIVIYMTRWAMAPNNSRYGWLVAVSVVKATMVANTWAATAWLIGYMATHAQLHVALFGRPVWSLYVDRYRSSGCQLSLLGALVSFFMCMYIS